MTILSATALVFGINIVTSMIKKWIYPTFGAFGVQIAAFTLAFIGSLYVLYAGQYPGFTHLVQVAGVIFSTSVAFYEVVLQHLDIFKGTPQG